MVIQVDNVEDAMARCEASRTKLIILSFKQFERLSFPVININKELSSLLVTIPRKKIPISAPKLFSRLISESPNDTVCLEGLEILFDRMLSVDPVKLLKVCARDKTILIKWPGEIVEYGFNYATPNHPEYRNYKTSDLSDVIFLTADAQL